MHEATPRDCYNMLWALATLDWPDVTWCWLIVHRFDERLGAASPRTCANMLWAMARLKMRGDPGPAKRMLARCVSDAEHLTSQAIAIALYAAGQLRVSNVDSAYVLLHRMLQVREDWIAIDVGQVLYGLRRAGCDTLPCGAEALVAYMVDHLDGMHVTACATAIFGLSGMSMVDGDSLQQVAQRYFELSA